MITALASGLLLGLSLIVAVGPQNAFVIRQGVRREHVSLVVVVCTASDVVLIAVAVGGVGALLDGRPELIRAVGIAGVVFLLGYAGLAAKRAWRAEAMTTTGRTSTGARAAVLTALAFTWLNPAVYVDTVFVVGPVAESHDGHRWSFGVGAMMASALWFVLLGFGARATAPVFARAAAWRALDASVAVIMLVTAVRIAVDLP